MKNFSISTQSDIKPIGFLNSFNNPDVDFDDERMESNEFSSNIDVMYLESLRAINEKIKACISCSEQECPIMKERMNRHIMQHHSFTNGERLSAQSGAHVYRNTSPKDDDTSPTSKYSKSLRNKIVEWSKDIPVYPNQIFEFKKQNLLNMLIENINDMSKNIDDEDYHLKLENVVNRFLNSLPGLNKEPLYGKLKDTLLDQIHMLNNSFFNDQTNNNQLSSSSTNKQDSVNRNTFGNQERSTSKEKNNIFFKPPETAIEDVTLPYKMSSQENSFSTASGKRISDMKSAANNTNASTVDCHRADGSTKPEVKEVATNAPLDNIVNESSKQNTSTNTVIQYYNEVIGPDIILCDEAYNTNDLANVQVQVTKSIMNAIAVDDNSTSDIEEYSRIKKIFKDKVFGWMNGLMENRDYKFVNNKVDKNFIANVLWDELKPHVISKSTEKSNRMLKRRLLDVLDRMPLSTSRLDPVYKHQIAEDLYSRLLGINYNDNDSKKYFVQNFNNCNIKDAMLDLQRDLKKILKKSFKSIGLDVPDNVQNEVALILLDSCNKNISNMRIKEKLFVFLKTLISLTTTETFDLINFIMEATKNYIKGIKYYESTSRTQNFGSLTFSGTLAVFPSEQELRGPTTSQKHKSAVKLQDNSNKSYDSTYLNNIMEIIRAWLDTLPKAFSSDEVQEENIQCLATEIYDQTQLEQLGEETKTESSKYKSFLIRKWLNKFDFFDDFSEAKPYIAHLVRELNDVRETESEKQQTKTIICCGTKSHISHPEYIMKNLILKFIEYNYLEDNLEVKSVFADLLKSELPNLSFPSRNEVYDTLQNKTDGISSFQRLDKELQYIIVIAECIQDVPLSDTFTNTKRNEIINKLAQNMYVAENKLSDSTSMEDIIQKFVDELPISILPGYAEYFDNIVADLIEKLINNRNSSPCCCFASAEKVNSSINVDTLSDYIESFIQENHQKLTENEIVLEACSLRLLNETNKLIKENPSAFDTAKVYERLGNADISNVQPIRRFSEEMKYAKDISDWLHNLPLLPVLNENDAINRTKEISGLTHKIREYSECKKQDSNNSDIEANFKGYLENWLLSLPLDSRKEIVIPVVIQQLINRIARINNQIYKEEGNGPNIVCQAPVPCCSNAKIKKKQDPATVIVETIEKWCNDLPIEGETEKVNLLKDSIATKLYQKIGDINNNPTYFNDDILYKDVLLHEIDVLLSNVPPNDKLLNRQLHLKNKLVQTIMDNKKLLKQKISGGRYKKQLEDKIAMSIAPNNTVSESEDPAFEIYKDRLATIFILDNFDHSNNAVKLKYENKIREDIDKYHKNALKRYTTAISKEQMFIDLYSALFDVSVPNEKSLCEEVEEIKTKCEIQIWFEKLPLREATNFAELLQLDKILSMLAKKIHQIENTEPNLDDKLHKEITKWLRRLPLSPGKEAHVDQFASELNARLKSTFSMRKCVPQVNISKLIEKVNSRTTAVPRSENEVENALTTFSQIRPRQIKRPMDVIIETVQAWCNNLPLPANTPQEAVNIKAFKDSIGIKIILKISELNLNPEIFNDNFQYDSLLDDELEKVFDLLSPCCDAVKNKNNLKKQLIDAINSIKPIIYEENSRYKYKQDLKTVVTNSLGLSQPETEQRSVIVNKIVDNFVIYNFYKSNNSEGQEMYKIMIIEAVKKYVTSRPNSKNFIDPIRKCDQLMCELSKVPRPSENVLVDEVEEIKMKFEVDEFLSELPLNEDGGNLPNKSKLKVTLARRLSDLEKSGHGSEIEQKMKEEVQKCLIKFHESIDALQIDSFIEKLKLTEPLRKSHPTNVGGNNYVNGNFVTPPLVNSYKTNYQTETNENLCCTPPLNTDENQWMSLMTNTPQNDFNNVESNTTSKQIPHNCGLCTTSTQDFGDRFEQTRGIYKEPNAIRPRSANFGVTNNDNRCLSNSNYQRDVEEQTYCRDKIPNQTDNSDITTETFEAAIRVTSTPVSHNSVGASNFDRYHNASVTFRRPNFIITQKQNQFSNSQKSASSCSKQCSQIHKSRTSVDNESDQELDVVSRVSGTRSQRALKQRDKEDQDLVRYQISSNRIPHSNCQSRNQSTNGPCKIIRDNDGSNQRKSSGACKPCRKSNLGMIGRKNTSESRVKKLDKEKPISSCTHSVSSDDEESCRCSKKLPHAKSCNTHAKKNCKICTTFSVPTCRYPGFYYC